MATEDTFAHCIEPGPLTAGGPHRAALKALPAALPELFAAVQGLLMHDYCREQYGLERVPEYTDTAHLRSAEHIVGRLLAGGRSLNERREPGERLGGSCRHFTLIAVAALRAHGTPARARCGFGTYFQPDWYIDHWVVERWDAATDRWVLCDAQMDEVITPGLPVAIDPLDLTRDQFVVAGEAWRRYRAGAIDPDRCGLLDEGKSGPWWIAGNLIRDIAALAGTELLPWDVWGAMPAPDETIGNELLELFDELAAITADPDTAADVRDRHGRDDRLRVPDQVFNFLRQAREPVITPA
ncbi:transglutaminase domain-containing protein [Glycomyces arizonensis]|uniref:transglutaminase domain-containing protein n=1 Tax=Glycomyces arizonensis TaxID=256035 RepID=UPI0003FB7B2E|nr:transglutaminase domain-containing protein [Glycomyces arizonensis]